MGTRDSGDADQIAERRYDDLPETAQEVVMEYALFFALNIPAAKTVACASMLPLDYQTRLDAALSDAGEEEKE